jgi:hypothetical protein
MSNIDKSLTSYVNIALDCTKKSLVPKKFNC